MKMRQKSGRFFICFEQMPSFYHKSEKNATKKQDLHKTQQILNGNARSDMISLYCKMPKCSHRLSEAKHSEASAGHFRI